MKIFENPWLFPVWNIIYAFMPKPLCLKFTGFVLFLTPCWIGTSSKFIGIISPGKLLVSCKANHRLEYTFDWDKEGWRDSLHDYMIFMSWCWGNHPTEPSGPTWGNKWVALVLRNTNEAHHSGHWNIIAMLCRKSKPPRHTETLAMRCWCQQQSLNQSFVIYFMDWFTGKSKGNYISFTIKYGDVL